MGRDPALAAQLTVYLQEFGNLEVQEAWTVTDGDLRAINTAQAPERVVPQPVDSAKVIAGALRAELAPVSWTAIRLATL